MVSEKIASIMLCFIMILCSIVILVEIAPCVEAPAILYVGGGPGNYSKIQWAIDNASDGDTVFVYNGTYNENIEINKTINLTGENRNNTTIRGSVSNGKDVVLITANWVNVSSLRITNGGLGGDDAGIELRNVRGCLIFNNNVSSNKVSGISLYNSDENNITDNIAVDTDFGIRIISSHRNMINRNNASSNEQYGIYMWLSDNNRITHNDIFHNNHIGLSLIDSMNNTCEYNNISYTDFKGFRASFSNNNTISHNNISKCFRGIEIRGIQ
jgi:parallel beta-helix repeat protein